MTLIQRIYALIHFPLVAICCIGRICMLRQICTVRVSSSRDGEGYVGGFRCFAFQNKIALLASLKFPKRIIVERAVLAHRGGGRGVDAKIEIAVSRFDPHVASGISNVLYNPFVLISGVQIPLLYCRTGCRGRPFHVHIPLRSHVLKIIGALYIA